MTNYKKIAIVGNASLKKAPFKIHLFSNKKAKYDSQYIDECDLVIRMNNASYWYNGAGKKTSILALVNRGNPAIGFALKPSKNLQKCAKKATEIWFTRPNYKFDSQLMKAVGKDQFKTDQSRKIINKLSIQNKPIRYISGKDYLKLISLLNKKNNILFEPSTGICSIYMAILNPNFKNCQFHLFGFTWEGWEGHNWDLEKKMCYELKQKEVLLFSST